MALSKNRSSFQFIVKFSSLKAVFVINSPYEDIICSTIYGFGLNGL